MKCQNCGAENSDSSKFCKECGSALENKAIKRGSPETNDKHKKIIIGLIIVILALLAIGALYGMGFFKEDIPLETKNFGAFKMDVPVGSNFVMKDSSSTDKKHLFVSYMNKGEYQTDAFAFFVGNNLTKNVANTNNEFLEKDGTIQIFKNESSEGIMYTTYTNNGKYQVIVMGSDLDTVKKMTKSVQNVNISKLKSDYNSPSAVSSTSSQTTQTTQTQNTAPTATALSILGGSFSTGSGLSDKTYASIYVGPEHSGENVKIQIWYSRDGSTLNNGNMVPKTVDSSGYINVRSADAYSKYPDYAEVNVYDTSGNLLDSVSVTLAPDSGTQSF